MLRRSPGIHYSKHNIYRNIIYKHRCLKKSQKKRTALLLIVQLLNISVLTFKVTNLRLLFFVVFLYQLLIVTSHAAAIPGQLLM